MSDIKIENAGVLSLPLKKGQQSSLFEWIAKGCSGKCPLNLDTWPPTWSGPLKKGDVFYVYESFDKEGESLLLNFARKYVKDSPYEEDSFQSEKIDPQLLKAAKVHISHNEGIVLSLRALEKLISTEAPSWIDHLTKKGKILTEEQHNKKIDSLIQTLKSRGVFDITRAS